MKHKSLNFIIPLVVYPFDVMVSMGQTDEQLEKILDKYLIEAPDTTWKWHNETAQGRFCILSSNQGLIKLRNIPETPVQYGYLQHEIFHYVTHILDRIGMKLILMKSDEAYAYMIGYLTEEIYKRFGK